MQTKAEPSGKTAVKMPDCSRKIFTVPNILSFVRLAMIPLIIYTYLGLQNSILTAVLLFLSGLTDALDGFIARRFNMISELGKALDPVADKLTQAVMLLCLVSRFPFILAAFIVLLVKEFFNGLGNLKLINTTGHVHGALWHGKLCTVLLYAVMVMHLIWTNIPMTVSYISISVCIAMLILSLVLYTVRNLKYRKK